MKYFDKMIINPDKTYKISIGGRINGRLFFSYLQRQALLQSIGETIREGHIQIYEDDERVTNAYMVALIKSCEEIRKRNPHITQLR